MSGLRDIGHLIQVPIEQIEFDNNLDIPSYQIAVLAEKMQQFGSRNWVPVIVQEPLPRQYRVLSNGSRLRRNLGCYRS
jgi:hypothetical protein